MSSIPLLHFQDADMPRPSPISDNPERIPFLSVDPIQSINHSEDYDKNLFNLHVLGIPWILVEPH